MNNVLKDIVAHTIKTTIDHEILMYKRNPSQQWYNYYISAYCIRTKVSSKKTAQFKKCSLKNSWLFDLEKISKLFTSVCMVLKVALFSQFHMLPDSPYML